MLILDLWDISFHAVVVFALGKNLLFKSVLGHCARPGTYIISFIFITLSAGTISNFLLQCVAAHLIDESIYAFFQDYV